MTTLVILQPGYLPWLGYFDQMNRADVFVHYDDVRFDKNGWRNRNRIKGPRGPLWLTVPVLHSGLADQSILETEIDERQRWQRKHAESVAQLYARAPFVDAILPPFKAILSQPHRKLVDLDLAVIEWLAAEIGVKTKCYRASELAIKGDRVQRLINLCHHFQATRYLSGDSGRDYIDVDHFKREGIEVVWQDYQHPIYPQLHGAFEPYLSALDLLLNVGPDCLGIISK